MLSPAFLSLSDFRSKFIELENDQFQLLSLIHETAVVGENAEIGDGTILFVYDPAYSGSPA